jgi:hypothetical protein
MEHALVVRECKEKAEDQKEKGIGNRGREACSQKAEQGKQYLDEKNVAFLEVPELKPAQRQERETGCHSSDEQQETRLAFTDSQLILRIQREYGEDDAHAAV